jgi:hypothetical protein
LLLTWLLPMLLLTDLFPTHLFRLVQPTCHHATRTEVNPTNTTIAMTRERNFSVASFRAVFQLGVRSMLQIPWLGCHFRNHMRRRRFSFGPTVREHDSTLAIEIQLIPSWGRVRCRPIKSQHYWRNCFKSRRVRAQRKIELLNGRTASWECCAGEEHGKCASLLPSWESPFDSTTQTKRIL